MLRNRNSLEENILRDFLKKQRIKRGYSQRKLSLILDNTPTFVSKYESGERYLLFTETVRICEILGIDAHELTDIIIGTLKHPSSEDTATIHPKHRLAPEDDHLHMKVHAPLIPKKTPSPATCRKRSFAKPS